jgi:ethanolamine utilization cobalamin adenosyltransferase
MDYQNDIRIDENALDVEWLQQASLTFEYGLYQAKCKKICDKKKEALDLVRADLDKAIRKSPEKYGIEKVTETAVSSAILQQEEYQEANYELIDARYELDIASGALRALQDKKSALENLVKLQAQNYFAGPSIPRDLNKEWENAQKTKQSNSKVAEGMQRKRKTE